MDTFGFWAGLCIGQSQQTHIPHDHQLGRRGTSLLAASGLRVLNLLLSLPLCLCCGQPGSLSFSPVLVLILPAPASSFLPSPPRSNLPSSLLPCLLYQKCKSPFLLSFPLCWPSPENCNPLFSVRESNGQEGPSLAVVFFIEQEGDGWGSGGEALGGGWESEDVRAERGRESGRRNSRVWRDLVPSESCRCESKSSL